LQYTTDNCTPAPQLKLGLRKKGTGTGFPVDSLGNPSYIVYFNCNDLGTKWVDLWSRDKYGNTSMCQTYIIVQDNVNNCNPPPPAMEVCSITETGNPLSYVGYNVSGVGSGIPSFTTHTLSDANGCAHLSSFPAGSSSTMVTPNKDDNPLNGVSTFDLVQISKHILGIKPLETPYKIIAADANKNGSITTFDIVELRKLILGIYTSLPNNTSWRFVYKHFTFPNPANPFATAFPESATLADLALYSDFVGVKIGDVNNSAIPFVDEPIPGDRGPADMLTLPDITLQPGEVREIPVSVADPVNWLGFQLKFGWSPDLLSVTAVVPGDGPEMARDNYNLSASDLSLSWSDATPQTILPGQRLFSIRVQARQQVALRDAIRLDPAGLTPESYPEGTREIKDLDLQFQSLSVAPKQTTIYAPAPNPTADGAAIVIYLAEPGLVKLLLTDATGRIVLTREQVAAAGDLWLQIPANAMPQNGVYSWQVTAGSMRQTGTLVKAQ
jgi:hypothetical protein